jgi:hypothetical protein
VTLKEANKNRKVLRSRKWHLLNKISKMAGWL